MHHRLALTALLVLSGACGAPAPAPLALEPALPPAAPASALAGVVYVLETLAAARPADCVVEVRALTAEVRHDSRVGRLHEHVALDLSVFAPTAERAFEAFGELRGRLEAASAGALRTQPAPAERVLAALDELGTRAGAEPLLSYSDRLQLELGPAPGAAAPATPAADFVYDDLERYVRSHASRSRAVGQVDLTPTSARPTGPREGLRILLAPGQPYQRYRTAEIGTFLASLENDSPAVRVTQLTIERSAHEPDVENPRGWTYAAELTVQARAPLGGV